MENEFTFPERFELALKVYRMSTHPQSPLCISMLFPLPVPPHIFLLNASLTPFCLSVLLYLWALLSFLLSATRRALGAMFLPVQRVFLLSGMPTYSATRPGCSNRTVSDALVGRIFLSPRKLAGTH